MSWWFGMVAFYIKKGGQGGLAPLEKRGGRGESPRNGWGVGWEKSFSEQAKRSEEKRPPPSRPCCKSSSSREVGGLSRGLACGFARFVSPRPPTVAGFARLVFFGGLAPQTPLHRSPFTGAGNNPPN